MHVEKSESKSIIGIDTPITGTPGHKYYLPLNKENRNPNEILEHDSYEDNWVSACDLKKGDKVLFSNGKYGIVRSVEVEELKTPETTYNFEVEDYHTYCVGEQRVCVHNVCRGTQRKKYWKERSNSLEALEKYGENNVDLMKQGLASKGVDGYKMILHRVKGVEKDFNFIVEMTRTDHIVFHRTFGYRNFVSVFDTNIPFFYTGG